MKRTILFFCAALAAFTLSAAVTVRESGTHFAEEALKPFVDSGALPGAIGVFYRNGIQETCCIGWADVEKKIPMTLDTMFMQCSQTKGFCGVTMAILIEEGKVKLDDPVSKYLPAFQKMTVRVKKKDGQTATVPARNAITIRMVMNHTSGLPPDTPYKREHGWPSRSLQDTARDATQQTLLFEPGTGVQYSNTGIDVGAAVIEVVTGKKWEVFLQERVLDPLEMKDTTFFPTDEQLSRAMALYDVSGKTPKRVDSYFAMPVPHNGPTVYASAGAGLWTTVRDQLKFYKMLMNLGVGENGRRILKEETVIRYLATSTRPREKRFAVYSMGLVANTPQQTFGHGGAFGTQCNVDAVKKRFYLYAVQLVGVPRPCPWDHARYKAYDKFFNAPMNEEVNAYTGRTK